MIDRANYKRILRRIEILVSEGKIRRDSDGTATAAACEDMPVPKNCQARPEGIAQ